MDLSRGFTVQSEQDERTGKWFVSCPACGTIVKAMTNDGINAAICVHLNERHFIRPAGNA